MGRFGQVKAVPTAETGFAWRGFCFRRRSPYLGERSLAEGLKDEKIFPTDTSRLAGTYPRNAGQMNVDTESWHITPVGGNVFADLGFEPEEAAALLAQTKRIVSEKRAIKEQLMSKVSEWIRHEHLKQAEAAQILGITRPCGYPT